VRRIQQTFLILVLFLVAFFIFSGERPVQTAPLKLAEREHLAASVSSHGCSVSYKEVEILPELGSFELYRRDLNKRESLMFGPQVPEASRGILRNGVYFDGADATKGVGYRYETKWLSNDTLRVRLAYITPPDMTTGIEFCICKLDSALFSGSLLVDDGRAGGTLPLRPRSFEDRIISSNSRSLTIRSSIVDVTIRSVNSPAISVADFRMVPWDRRKSFYIFATDKMLAAGRSVTLCYDITFNSPSIPAKTQYDQSPSAPPSRRIPEAASFFGPIQANRQPDIPVRGVLSELLSPGVKDVRLLKGYLKAIARSHGNTLILYHRPEHVRLLASGATGSKWWSRAELEEIAAFARSLNIEVIPGISSKLTAQQFPDLLSGSGEQFYNPFDGRSYGELFQLYQTLLDIYHPKALLIGHDEIRNIGKNKPKGWSHAQVLSYDVTKIHGWLSDRGVKTLIFGDMLLDRNAWRKEIAANSNNVFYDAVDTHKAIDSLPKDIVILDWQYQALNDYPTLGYFKNKGFAVWGVSWYDPKNALQMAQSVKRYKADGIFASDWGLWRTLSPAATSLYALKAGWDATTRINAYGVDAVAALADDMRAAMRSRGNDGFVPVPIEEGANDTTWDETFGDGKGFLDLGSGFDLRYLEGEQRLSGIPFRILRSASGSRNNCLVADGRQPTCVHLHGLTATRLAFLHTMRAGQPEALPKPVGGYEVIYENGRKLKIDLVENFNITDFRSSPGLRSNAWGFSNGLDILLGSYPGWFGTSLSGGAVNLQVLLWDNPFPKERIRKICLVPVERFKLALVAISAAN
jgi:hypothetical protein